MYAVFQTGGKQHRVREGQILRIEKLNALTGQVVEFKQVMLITNGDEIQVGGPFIKDSMVMAEVVAHGRSDKVMIVKFRRRKHFRKLQGHRQPFTDIKITAIFAS
ncbi:50S ribosomal protein L21 [Candidatus Steffania adelgidicola]|uniref:50S ribosomal protein L21 n=1 Tax=Candidatus Steffania adelgidicola TaxID=1076626 RepID=UPI001D008BF0|nr:50S ribosomal protein L21 [Candidatus Steffania adelgidicola]